MKIQQFLDHHKIERNPFAEEDAQTDPVFKDLCIEMVYHPAWDKVYGDPKEPATAVVFGEKGSGKTAIRLQIARHLKSFNEKHPEQQLFVMHYDDFNPFLDRFREHVGLRKSADKVLAQWRLWDHMDAILSIAVTGLVDRILETKQPLPHVDADIDPSSLANLDHFQQRDLMMLAGLYDESVTETYKSRWQRLRKKIGFGVLKAQLDAIVGYLWAAVAIGIFIALACYGHHAGLHSFWLYPLLALLGWIPYAIRFIRKWMTARGIVRHTRTGNRKVGPLRRVLMQFTRSELSAQPLPDKDRTEDRYECLQKLQGILHSLGFPGMIVLVDRVDEPDLINGSAELMKALIWPLLDNKFLKHSGIGLKLMLPIELTRYIEREDREFYQRARLDKQNMIKSFQWTGEALYDVANARLKVCAKSGNEVTLTELVDESISHTHLIASLRNLRVPRHLFKFLYQLLSEHCQAHSENEPSWRISSSLFESVLAVHMKEQDSFDRGMGSG